MIIQTSANVPWLNQARLIKSPASFSRIHLRSYTVVKFFLSLLFKAKQTLIGPVKLSESIFRGSIITLDDLKAKFLNECWSPERQQKQSFYLVNIIFEMADYFTRQLGLSESLGLQWTMTA